MNNFLLEILVQELPYKFIPDAIRQLKDAFSKLLNENLIEYGNIDVYGTPRRLAVIIKDLAHAQKDIEKDARGPILSIAKDANGNYTPAALGFAKKNNVDEKNLYEKDNYIWAKIEIKGKSVKEILQDNIEKIILSMQGAHFMRWKDLDIKFSRPIENIVALFNEETLPLTVVDQTSTNTTRGLRFYNDIKIKNPLTYIEQLKENHILVDQNERREKIVELANKKAEEIDAKVHFEDDLLDEVTYLTEAPKPVLCSFDKKYLQIPDIVNVTVMAVHQRYFPLYDKNNKLLNNFITMANFVNDDEESIENIKRGNQRVVCARLEDGIFFYKEDSKDPLINKVENLKGMTFQRGLGTLYDKTQRILALCPDDENIKRCATLCKADLSTKLVFEFTELQGFIGEDYARKSGECEEVAKGISEHYYPLNATSEIASGKEGQIVGILDKIDTICAVFISTQDNKKKRPTGSADPLGVRRATLGVLRTILGTELKIDLTDLISKSLKLLSEEFNIEIKEETQKEIEEFFINRLIIMRNGKYETNVLEAVAGSIDSPLKDLKEYFKKVEKTLKLDAEVIENAKRVGRIIPKDKKEFRNVDEKLFKLDEEKELYKELLNTKDYDDFNNLARETSKFFDKVLVMDNDENIKENRIALLNEVNSKFKTLCDFLKL
ncbi:MAG: glycine--tRNA ligase subunit beta [Cyanobacteria bacterium SIG30]|nr:glycine--tRNA ligase subunit beta [Cyanobacteria bacterium SIG30]